MNPKRLQDILSKLRATVKEHEKRLAVIEAYLSIGGFDDEPRPKRGKQRRLYD